MGTMEGVTVTPLVELDISTLSLGADFESVLEVQCIQEIRLIVLEVHAIAIGLCLQFSWAFVQTSRSFWPPVMTGWDPAASRFAPHAAEDALTASERKQSQAPFLPPEKRIFPPTANTSGLAVTVAEPVKDSIS
jgi:hypothetical protein